MPKDNKKKSMGTSRAYNRRGSAADVQKSISANTKKFKAMTPAQKKTYIAQQAKALGKTTAQVASMVGGAGLVRKGGVAAARKLVPAKKMKLDQTLNKMGKALSNSTPPKRTTPASQPSSELMRNIGRQSALRRKFPEKFNPNVKKK
jgi:hypothetical protein